MTSHLPPLVVVGGSAGAIAPLRRIVTSLPSGFGAAVCVAIHLPERSPSALPSLLSRPRGLRSGFAHDGELLEPGAVYVAPPGAHLLVHDGHLTLSRGATENGSRPAVDPLFRSAARAAGPRIASVLLSGALDDGTAGTIAVRRAGGVTIVQDPDDAVFPDMPRHALATGTVMRALRTEAIAGELSEVVEALARRPLPPSLGVTDADSVERGLAGPATDLPGTPSPYACPDCGGVLYGHDDDQYLCRVGHRYSAMTLASGQLDVVEDALWTALRSLEEAASLAARVRDRAGRRGDRAMARRFEGKREDAQARADRIRALLSVADADESGEPSEAAGAEAS